MAPHPPRPTSAAALPVRRAYAGLLRVCGLPLLWVVACTCNSTGSNPPRRQAPSRVSAAASSRPPPSRGSTAAPSRPSPSPSAAASEAAAPVAPAPPAAPTIDYCRSCREPVGQGSLPAAVDEASGLAASRLHLGAYYVHNDSGDQARFYAIDLEGADHGTYELEGASARDWEDMAVGPCPAGSCVYLADIGDNAAMRDRYVVHRVAEPAQLEPGRHPVASEPLPFSYPDGSHDAETLLCHPVTGELVVVTKVRRGASGAYRFPQPLLPGTAVELVKIAELTPPTGTQLITGGEVHPAGHGILLRTYSDVFYLPLSAPALSTGLLSTACRLPRPLELQGETVAWTAAGDGYVTVSEGRLTPLQLFVCGAP